MDVPSTLTTTTSYDADERPSQVTDPLGRVFALSYAKTFAYDPVGNRKTQTTTGAGAGSVTYAYDTRDRLTTENTTTYAYDADGEVTSKSSEATYGWDFENRLTKATMTSGAVVAHEYDADGNRVQTSATGASAATTNMLVDTVGCASCGGGLSQVVAETDGSGDITAVYVRAGDELLAVMRPADGGTWTTRFIHHDGLGSVRALTNETGTTTDTRGHEAFGTKNVEAGNDPLVHGFAGEPFQPDSMLAYHRARWIDARVGRFLGMDTHPRVVRDSRTIHRYLYVRNNPTNWLDPSGNDDLADVSVSVVIVEVLATEAAPSLLAESTSIVGEAFAYNAETPCGRGVGGDYSRRRDIGSRNHDSHIGAGGQPHRLGYGAIGGRCRSDRGHCRLAHRGFRRGPGCPRSHSRLGRRPADPICAGVDVPAKVAANVQLLPRIALMLKLLDLWPR